MVVKSFLCTYKRKKSARGRIFYYIGQSVIEPNGIIEKVMAIKGENKDVSITISGDEYSNYGSVIGLMALLKEAGFSKVGLKTEPRTAK